MSGSAKFLSAVAEQMYELAQFCLYIVHQGKPKRHINTAITSVSKTEQMYQSCWLR